jgi:signal transduction histidine kinase
MKATVNNEALHLPDFSPYDIEVLKTYFELNRRYYKKVNQELTAKLSTHPLFGSILSQMTPEQREAQNERSQELQRAAIFDGKWIEYTHELMAQGKMYARMNVSYGDWYEIIAMYKMIITPYIKKDFEGNAQMAITFMEGLSKFVDYAMYGIAEAYFQEKNIIIRELNDSLEKKVLERTEELNATNKELESFSYSVSHDLRGPLRAINGFTRLLQEALPENISEEAKDCMHEVIGNTRRMGLLIDSLLEFSRLGKKPLTLGEVDMDELVKGIVKDVKQAVPAQQVNLRVKPLGKIRGDRGMLRQVLTNLVTNAFKYSSKKPDPEMEIGSYSENGSIVYYVRDNGAGFNMAYYKKLFGVFQRLHSEAEFEGTGVGLAIAQRIVAKHQGKMWAEGKVGEGATFYFSLPNH